MSRYFSLNIEPALGSLGLLLMLLVVTLTPAAYGEGRTLSSHVRGFFARRAIDGIATVGWLADRLPPPARFRNAAAGLGRAALMNPSTHWRV